MFLLSNMPSYLSHNNVLNSFSNILKLENYFYIQKLKTTNLHISLGINLFRSRFFDIFKMSYL